MAKRRRPAQQRPLINVSFGGQPKKSTPRNPRGKLPRTRAIARRVGKWTGAGVGAGVGACVRHATSTTGRWTGQVHRQVADTRDARRVHRSRAVVRDVDGGPPLSMAQVQSRLLGLETARANADGAPQPAHAQVLRPLPDTLLRSAAAPVRLSWWDRRRLPREWSPDDVTTAQAAVTNALAARITPRPPSSGPVDLTKPTPTSPAAPPVLRSVPTQGDTDVIEYKNVADLANPQIDPQQWEVELPADAQNAAALFQEIAEALQARLDYFQGAQSPEEIVRPLQEAVSMASTLHQGMAAVASAAESYVANLRVPHFERVS